ncbi:TPA: hypothetical protein P0E04_004132 [Vibrio campbellii]|nr:hypothetical protein DZA51_01120 [Vibrio campbellii]HDM8045881.1 hypothetical protein [Vibrio campbellii]
MKKSSLLLTAALFSSLSVNAFASTFPSEGVESARVNGEFRVTIINDSTNYGAGWQGLDSNPHEHMTGYMAPMKAHHFFLSSTRMQTSYILDANLDTVGSCPGFLVNKDINVHINSETGTCWID